MGMKRLIRKMAKLVLSSSPEKNVTVQVARVTAGSLLAGRRVVVTGGGRGIGLAMAERFASEGARVCVSGRNEEALKKACERIGSAASYVVADAREVEWTSWFLDECERRLGGSVDSLVANAGVSLHEGRFSKVTPKSFDIQFETNLRGTYFLSTEFLGRCLRAAEPTGNLLVITSETGEQAYDTPYGMTKAAMDSFVRAASRRVYRATDGAMRVNAIAPGVTLSEMTAEYVDTADGNLYRNCASGRVFLPEEVAEVALFLLSDASKCISGEVVHTNAGNHIKAFWDGAEDE